VEGGNSVEDSLIQDLMRTQKQ